MHCFVASYHSAKEKKQDCTQIYFCFILCLRIKKEKEGKRGQAGRMLSNPALCHLIYSCCIGGVVVR